MAEKFEFVNTSDSEVVEAFSRDTRRKFKEFWAHLDPDDGVLSISVDDGFEVASFHVPSEHVEEFLTRLRNLKKVS